MDTAVSAHSAAAARLTAAQDALTAARTTLVAAQTASSTAATAVSSSTTALTTARANVAVAESAVAIARSALASAQAAYDGSSVPNPAYVPPAVSVQPTSYQIPDANFMTGTPWVGDGSGQSGQPEVHPGHLHFSYIGTEVYQDVLISPRALANYTFTVGVWNQDQNSVGQGAVADTYSLRIYFYDADGALLHQNSVTSSEVHSWRDVVLSGNTGTTAPVSRVRIGVYGIDNGFWAGTYGPAANNVRLTLGWITGSTPGSTTTGTVNVSINEGGESTYTAPNGGVFVSSSLRYQAIDDPSCGVNVTPSNLGSNTVTLVADNSLWGDPCGGWYKQLVGTLTYSVAQPQFIKDASLLPAVATHQSELDAALAALTAAQSAESTASSAVAGTTSEAVSVAASLLVAQDAVTTAEAQESDAADDAADTLAVLEDARSDAQSATTELSSATAEQSSVDAAVTTATAAVAAARSTLDTTAARVSSLEDEVNSLERQIEELPEPEPEPEPTPEPEEPTEEIDPRDLTDEEVEALVEEAEATLETAEPGSSEYNAALEQLAVAAQADDPQLPEALAAIPLLGETAAAVLEAFNDLGNIGADMAPAVREDAEKVVVGAVIVTQVATQAATMAAQAAAGAATAAAAAASTSAPSGGSGGGSTGGGARRVGN